MSNTTVHQILSLYHIPYKDEAKAVNINCPFCIGRTSGLKDEKYRCGIFSTFRFHCFRCNKTGSLYDILKCLKGISFEEYRKLVKGKIVPNEELSLKDSILAKLHPTQLIENKVQTKVQLPKSFPITKQILREEKALDLFIKQRNLSLSTLNEYKASYTGKFGPYSYRLILPIYNKNKKLVAWQGRDVTNREQRYHTEGKIDNVLYRTKEIKSPYRIYVVEGIFDCWRMGYNSIATFTHNITEAQIDILLMEDWIEEIVFAYDGDSYRQSFEGAMGVLGALLRVGAIRLPEGYDPDKLGGDEVRRLEIRWN